MKNEIGERMLLAQSGICAAALLWVSREWVTGLLWMLAWIPLMAGVRGSVSKIWAYLLILPFAAWWMIVPEASSGREVWGISPYVFWIPAWYFAWLGLLRFYAAGGSKTLSQILWINALLIGICGFFLDGWGRLFLVLWVLTSAEIFRSLGGAHHYSRRRVVRYWIFVILCSWVSWTGWLWIRDFASLRGFSASAWSPQIYRNKGFSAVSWLGAFAEDYLAGARDNQVILRVFSSVRPEYLRGAVYAQYRAGVWVAVKPDTILYPQTQIVEYSVFALSPIHARDAPIGLVFPAEEISEHLFVPLFSGAVAVRSDSLRVSRVGMWLAEKQWLNHGYGYYLNASSFLSDAQNSDWHLSNPVRIWLDSLLPTVQGGRRERVNAWMAWLKQRAWTYSLQIPLKENEDPLRAFVRHGAGYCEYFASLGTLSLRFYGIPARYVTGFSSPEKVENAWVFRGRSAHAWVEWQNDSGYWEILDPTPPQSRPVVNEELFYRDWLERIKQRLVWWRYQLLDGAWKMRIEAWSDRLRGTRMLGWWGAVLLGVFLLSLFRSGLLRRRVDAASSWKSEFERLERALSERGVRVAPWETADQLLLRLPSDLDQNLVERLRHYARLRFAFEPEKSDFRRDLD